MSILGSILGGAISLFGSSKAASAQEDAANSQLALQRQIFEQNTENFEPFLNSGVNALNALNFELFGGDRPIFNAPEVEDVSGPRRTYVRNNGEGLGVNVLLQPGSTGFKVNDQTFGNRADAEAYANSLGQEYQGYSLSPAAQSIITEGTGAVEAGAAGIGGLYSGATLAGIEARRADTVIRDRDNYYNRLAAMAGQGQAAAGQQAGAGAQYAAGGSSALANRGNATAAGYIGGANALNQGIENIVTFSNFNRNKNALYA